MGDNHEGSGGMEVKIADRMKDPPRELIPVIEEDSNDIPILEENRDPIPVSPPRIGNTENIEIIEMASQVSHQHCIRSLGQILRQTPCLGTIGTEHLRVTNWHFSRSFYFYFIALTLAVIVQSLIPNTSLHSLTIHFVFLLCFRPSRKSKRVYSNP